MQEQTYLFELRTKLSASLICFVDRAENGLFKVALLMVVDIRALMYLDLAPGVA